MTRKGFFSMSLPVMQAPPPLTPRCGSCGLDRTCRSPKMPPAGEGRRGILVVGEAPGEVEDERNTPFVGPSGRLLQAAFREFGYDLFRDCWVVNSLSCFVGTTKVQSPSAVRKVYRRSYSGVLHTVKTASGRVLTGTPNHPVMTTKGWVPLGLLQKGDNLICRTPRKGAEPGRPDVYNRPTPFHQVLGSASEITDLGRVIGRSVDFHGDGEDGYVDVVSSDGLLGGRVQSPPSEHFDQDTLVPADELLGDFFGSGGRGASFPFLRNGTFTPASRGMGRVSQFDAILHTHPTPPDFHSRPFISGDDAEAVKDALKSIGGDSERIRQRLQALSGLVTTDSVLDVERQACDQSFGGYDAVKRTPTMMKPANGNVSANESRSNTTPGGTEFIGQLLKGELPGGVLTDYVVEVEVQLYDRPTHVYNLETEDGYYLASDIIVSNCRPPDNKITNPNKIDHCRPLILKALREFRPSTVILLGASAVRSVVGHLWKRGAGGKGLMQKWNGWQIPSQELNAYVCPTYHPSHVMRKRQNSDDLENPVAYERFRDQLRAALDLDGRPWDEVPDYRRSVDVWLDTNMAADFVSNLGDRKGWEAGFAFDFETNMLKPDSEAAEIVCCSVSNGKDSLAFPWHGRVIRSVSQALTNPKWVKFGWNQKFEDRWCRAKLGIEVVNWHPLGDGMLTSHALDSRAGITSLKFQAFARLGMPDYDSHVRPYLKADGGNTPNRIRELPIEQVLLYTGLDSLLEYKLNKMLMGEIL